MEKEKLLELIKKARENTKKRNFAQSFDIIVNLQHLSLNKPEEQIEFFIQLNYGKGRDNKVCALVGGELIEEAKKFFDNVITQDNFDKYDVKAIKKLSSEYDLFVAQGDIMAQVAKYFGRVFGPRGKMPNPKAGCVVPPKGANLQAIAKKLKNTLKASAKKSLVMQITVGNEKMKDDEIASNIIQFYKQLINTLPQHENNIRNIKLKLTMGKSVELM